MTKTTRQFSAPVIGSLCILLLAALLASQSAKAAQVGGTVTISLNGNWNASTLASGWSPTTYFDASFNSTEIVLATPGGTPITGPISVVLPVNTITTSTTTAGGTVQATTMDTSDSSSGQIGLSGAFRLTSATSPSNFLVAEDFQLRQVNGTWNLLGVSGFGPSTFLQLVNVVDDLAGAGTLEGDLQFLPNAANSVGFPWATFLGASGAALTTNFGHLSLSPAPVPVPAAAWLLCSGLAGVAGFARRRTAA